MDEAAIMKSVLSRIIQVYRIQGGYALFSFLFSRIIVRKWKTLVYEYDLTKLAESHHMNSVYQVCWWDRQSIKNISQKSLNSLDATAARQMLENVKSGDLAYTIMVEENITHYGCVMFNSRQNIILSEAGDTPLIGYCYTHPDYRRKGMYTKGLRATAIKFKEKGFKKLIIETHPDNLYSSLGIKKAGFILSKYINGYIIFNTICVFLIKKHTNKRIRIWMIR